MKKYHFNFMCGMGDWKETKYITTEYKYQGTIKMSKQYRKLNE